MSKLPKKYRFVDLSDYGRAAGNKIAVSLKNTCVTPIHVTLLFLICGILATVCILFQYYWAAAALLVLKSILDAADGELARIKKTPSYTGRYLDSISDIILNILLFTTIWKVTEGSVVYTILALIGLQLQGTLYNYYYVILRNRFHGDTTSRVFEKEVPKAMKGEKQQYVNILFKIYRFFYGPFDKMIYHLDRKAVTGKILPKWFMTAVSTFGLGFQLLIIGGMLAFDLKDYIIPFFIGFSFFIFIFIGLRRFLNR
ncbi:CDP-alcohol phosphatidyltransferase family protein [uncultured Muriicola sp.]|uniref:CDP-alcohol phosphatidyltransferase family protein n=1 Tax=uncultured Muriicola sp. TaxID=1583102 RepID=UPI00260DFF1A|nr:CDP-alcohol phosphatidyltransferase family protein [uncultured Muriicola sp.]